MNLAAFKKLCVKGVQVHGIHARLGDLGIRPISIVQSNAIAFRTDKGTDSWVHFPKAKDIVYNKEADTWTISIGGTPLLTYKFLN